MKRHIAIYCRVSSKKQNLRSQIPDLERWAATQDQPIKWFRDRCTGTKMDRPQWNRLEVALRAGAISSIVVWRLDRLGRTCKGLVSLFEELRQRKVNLVSLREHIDLSTPAGRMMAQVLASVAEFETELRGERVLAGQAIARQNGKRWGGSRPGVRKKVTAVQIKAAMRMQKEGEKVSAIARALGLSRPTIYSVLAEN